MNFFITSGPDLIKATFCEEFQNCSSVFSQSALFFIYEIQLCKISYKLTILDIHVKGKVGEIRSSKMLVNCPVFQLHQPSLSI